MHEVPNSGVNDNMGTLDTKPHFWAGSGEFTLVFGAQKLQLYNSNNDILLELLIERAFQCIEEQQMFNKTTKPAPTECEWPLHAINSSPSMQDDYNGRFLDLSSTGQLQSPRKLVRIEQMLFKNLYRRFNICTYVVVATDKNIIC